jgi:density-regulated protein DRP1
MGRKKRASRKKEQHSDSEDEENEEETVEENKEEAPDEPVQPDGDSDTGSEESGSDNEEDQVSKPIGVQVEYCPKCTFPFEYCEYAGMIEQCKPGLMEWMKRKAVATEGEGEIDEASLENKVKQKKKTPEGVEKMLPGGKVKKKEENMVVISVASRQKRKAVTSITGLELFGVKLADAAKDFKKKFSCGAAVVKTPTGKEQIDIQGEFRDQLLEMWEKQFKTIPKSAVFVVDEGKNKVAAFE